MIAPDASMPDRSDASAVDASLPEASACTPVVVTDPLTSIDPSMWRVERDGSNGSYPKIVSPPEAPLTAPILSLVTPWAGNSRGGIWLRTNVPTRAFDVSFSIYVRCVAGCGDGAAVAWLSTTNAAVVGQAASGHSFGIPPTVAGAAVAVDLYRNSQTGDGPTPNVSLLALDSARNPGDYPWTVAKSPADSTLLGALRKLEIRARGGVVETRVDGQLAVSGTLPTGFSALFGITAASGGEIASFFVRDFAGSFYDCDP